jgi:hypothetical protein
MSIAQTNKFILEYVNPGALMLKIVTIKLREPSMDEIPVKCSAKIAQSTDIFGEKLVERGGYTVQPVPAPISVKNSVLKILRIVVVTKNLSCSVWERPYR